MTVAEAAALAGDLAQAEAQAQDYLAARPPPFFVARKLSFAGVPAADRVPLLRAIFPTVREPAGFEMLALTDGAAISQRDDIASLNRYFHAELERGLATTIGGLRTLGERARALGDADAIYRCDELLGYLLTEACHWRFISQPLPVLRFDAAVLAEASARLQAAAGGASRTRDWLRWHRVAANQARLGYLSRDKTPALVQTFDQALALGQLCLDHGIAVDRAFVTRRDELLHLAAAVKFAQRDPTYPNLAAHIKAPAQIKPPPGAVRLMIEAGKLIANMGVPLLYTLDEASQRISERTAYLDWLSTETDVQLWMMNKGRLSAQSLSYREMHADGNLDLMFRPTVFEVSLDAADKRMGASDEAGAVAAQERIAYLGNDLSGRAMQGSTAIAGKRWDLRFPTLEVGLDEAGRRFHRETQPEMSGVPWEAALGRLLQRVLPTGAAAPAHLVVSTDGPMSLLPFHLARMPDGRYACEQYSISYAPSIAYYSPAPAIADGQAPRVAVVLNSRNRLAGPVWELAQMRSRLGAAAVLALDGYAGDDRALEAELASCDVIHVATHGVTFTATPDASGVELQRGRMLTISSIERFTLKPGCLVFLNACGSNQVTIRSRIQYSSIANAFLSAGAGTVIATFWEADDVSAALLSDRFYHHYLDERKGRLESLELAIGELTAIDLDVLPKASLGTLALFLPPQRKQPYVDASYWGQFALFGHW